MAVAASITPVATAGTLWVLIFYSPTAAETFGSGALSFVLRLLKLDAVAIAGALLGAIGVVPLHSVLVRQGFTLGARAALIGFLSFGLLVPVAIAESMLLHSMPAFWLVLALPAAAIGIFATLIFDRIRLAPRVARIVALVGIAIMAIGLLLWVCVPSV